MTRKGLLLALCFAAISSGLGALSRVGLDALGPNSAEAETISSPPWLFNAYGGLACQPLVGQAALTSYGEPGVGNVGTPASTVNVWCPYMSEILTGADPDWATMRYIDNNTTNQLWCYAYLSGDNGTGWWSRTKWSCSGNATGCESATSDTTGVGNIRWENIDFFSGTSYYSVANAGIRCQLPGNTWIQSYEVRYRYL